MARGSTLANTLLCVLAFCNVLYAQNESTFVIPEVTIQALKPKGLRVSIKDQPGIQFFGFHAQVNKVLTNTEPGDIVGEINESKGNEWVYTNNDIQLKTADTIYYWYFIQHDRLGYRREDQNFVVRELVDAPSSGGKETGGCSTPSKFTHYNGNQKACPDEVIFHDDFTKSSQLDESKWVYEQYFPEEPNNEFVIYTKRTDTAFIKNSVLYLGLARNPELSYKNLGNVCTRPGKTENCERRGGGKVILPPVLAGQVRSKFKFRYGKIEINAKLPKGDWIYPIISITDSKYETTCTMVLSRGNEQLSFDGNEIGSRLLQSEVPFANVKKEKLFSQPLYSSFHKFEIIWNPQGYTFLMDGDKYGNIPSAAFAVERIGDEDPEFHINLGIAVGGRVFPDNSISNNNPKPWTNERVDTLLSFNRSYDHIESTWNREDSSLKIQSITVRAL